MGKLLIFLGIIVAVYFLFFRKKSLRNDSQKNDEVSFEMVECAVCGTYTAKDEAIKKGNKYFCSTKCLG
ncbi:PP0621 family protein [Helicobacter sp. 23-1045]